MTRAATALLLIAAVPALAATRARYLMGTVCEVSAAGERQIEAAFAEAARVESMISTWRDDSELAKYNASLCGAGNLAGGFFVRTRRQDCRRHTESVLNPPTRPRF